MYLRPTLFCWKRRVIKTINKKKKTINSIICISESDWSTSDYILYRPALLQRSWRYLYWYRFLFKTLSVICCVENLLDSKKQKNKKKGKKGGFYIFLFTTRAICTRNKRFWSVSWNERDPADRTTDPHSRTQQAHVGTRPERNPRIRYAEPRQELPSIQ